MINIELSARAGKPTAALEWSWPSCVGKDRIPRWLPSTKSVAQEINAFWRCEEALRKGIGRPRGSRGTTTPPPRLSGTSQVQLCAEPPGGGRERLGKGFGSGRAQPNAIALTDYHLVSASCSIERGNRADAKDHLEAARSLIDKTGYYRRSEELKHLEEFTA